MNSNNNFLVKVQFTVVVNTPNHTEEKKNFTKTFELARKAAKMPWFALRNYILPTYLNKELGQEGIGWARLYEFKIIEMLNTLDPADISDIPLRVMTRDQLKLYVSEWELGVDVEEFSLVEEARMMVALKKEDPKGYEAQLMERRAKRSTEVPGVEELRRQKDIPLVDKSDAFEELKKKQTETVQKVEKIEEEKKKVQRGRKPKAVQPIVQEEIEETASTNPFDSI